jgi:hypothetical protein
MRIQTAGMKLSRHEKDCSNLDRIKNEGIGDGTGNFRNRTKEQRKTGMLGAYPKNGSERNMTYQSTTEEMWEGRRGDYRES